MSTGRKGSVIGANSSEITCKSCKVGTYRGNDDTNLTQCIDCKVGFHINSTGQPFCKACDVGTFTNSTRSRTCQHCPLGFYQPNKRSKSCNSCNQGKYTIKIKQAWCFDCDAGRYAPNIESTTNCSECPLGFAQPKKGQLLCTKCETGKISTAEIKTSCEKGKLYDAPFTSKNSISLQVIRQMNNNNSSSITGIRVRFTIKVNIKEDNAANSYQVVMSPDPGK